MVPLMLIVPALMATLTTPPPVRLPSITPSAASVKVPLQLLDDEPAHSTRVPPAASASTQPFTSVLV